MGATGAMLSPTDGSQTSSAVTLQAAVPGSYTKATYEYRYGTSGSFAAIPDHVVYDCACPVTWPVSTTTNNAGVQTDALTWYMNRTLSDDGPVQVEAVFADASGNTMTMPPVTVSLDRLGTGADYGTASVGPVTVGLQSGNAALSESDLSVAGYGATLSVGRTFNSVAPAKSSIFGPGWVSSIESGTASSWSSITDDGDYVLLTGGNGSTYDFATGYTGDGPTVTASLTLTKNTSANTFILTDSSAAVTTFQVNASTGNVAEIDFVYVDNAGAFHSVAMADYGYDASGRLVSEWDPRLSTPLVTGYTYDETSTDADYGRITRISPAEPVHAARVARVLDRLRRRGRSAR